MNMLAYKIYVSTDDDFSFENFKTFTDTDYSYYNYYIPVMPSVTKEGAIDNAQQVIRGMLLCIKVKPPLEYTKEYCSDHGPSRYGAVSEALCNLYRAIGSGDPLISIKVGNWEFKATLNGVDKDYPR